MHQEVKALQPKDQNYAEPEPSLSKLFVFTFRPPVVLIRTFLVVTDIFSKFSNLIITFGV